MELSFGSYSNGNGYSWAAVKDLQRVVACLDISAGRMPDDEYGAKIAGFEFSARVTVPMSAQAEWRTGDAPLHSETGMGTSCHFHFLASNLAVFPYIDMFGLQRRKSRSTRQIVGIRFQTEFLRNKLSKKSLC